MIVEPKMRPRYTLAELLSQGDFTQPITSDEREWLDAPPFGGEGL
jgi:antitoxin ChpS